VSPGPAQAVLKPSDSARAIEPRKAAGSNLPSPTNWGMEIASRIRNVRLSAMSQIVTHASFLSLPSRTGRVAIDNSDEDAGATGMAVPVTASTAKEHPSQLVRSGICESRAWIFRGPI
jgi:hypothetical protein